MRRPVAELLDQRSERVRRIGPPVRNDRLRVHILAVEVPARVFVVNAKGYHGPRKVRAAPSIDFGTVARPKVFKGDDCLIEKIDGKWWATQYFKVLKCSPDTAPVAPNIPLPTTLPNPSSASFDFGVNLLPDIPFDPNVLPLGEITPPSLRAPGQGGTGLTFGGGSIAIQDGVYDAVSGIVTLQFWPAIFACRWNAVIFTVQAGTDMSWDFALDGVTRINATRVSGVWAVTVNDATGAPIETDSPGSTDEVSQALANPVPMTVGQILRITLTPTGSLSQFGYGVSGY